jgi:hypothetical protein
MTKTSTLEGGLEWTSGTGYCAAQPMSLMGQNPNLPHRSTDARFTLISRPQQGGSTRRFVPIADSMRQRGLAACGCLCVEASEAPAHSWRIKGCRWSCAALQEPQERTSARAHAVQENLLSTVQTRTGLAVAPHLLCL